MWVLSVALVGCGLVFHVLRSLSAERTCLRPLGGGSYISIVAIALAEVVAMLLLSGPLEGLELIDNPRVRGLADRTQAGSGGCRG